MDSAAKSHMVYRLRLMERHNTTLGMEGKNLPLWVVSRYAYPQCRSMAVTAIAAHLPGLTPCIREIDAALRYYAPICYSRRRVTLAVAETIEVPIFRDRTAIGDEPIDTSGPGVPGTCMEFRSV